MRLSGSPMRPELLRIATISRVEEESRGVKTLYFSDRLCSEARPGQFLMIWAPGVDEVPMSLSTISRERVSVTVKLVGEGTRAIHKMRVGDRMGVRGPFGNGFTISGSRPLLVGGGTGVAALKPLLEAMLADGVEPTFILGARSLDDLLFRSHLEKLLGRRLFFTTDDGSLGFKGFASDLAMRLMGERDFDSVYICGPEPMICKVFEEAERRGLPIQASLERYIKCAVGLCGSCALGPFRVCRDGPVFNSQQLRLVRDELGRTRMDPSGLMISIEP
ncbi:MAG: dihydroorotate dehydrogenase electron transfer subunit [Candidatus Bathyarchaeia archaeon]